MAVGLAVNCPEEVSVPSKGALIIGFHYSFLTFTANDTISPQKEKESKNNGNH